MKEFYLSHLKEGYKLHEIDEMDFFYYLDLMAYKATKKDVRYMDDDF